MDYHLDTDMHPRRRFTRKDVMTPLEAVKAFKSMKTHKLKPRSNKRDRTKTIESKAWSKSKRFNHMCDLNDEDMMA